MALHLLDTDSLTTAASGFDLHVGLPWIRSLPLTSVMDARVVIDGRPQPGVRAVIGSRLVEVGDLRDEVGWWYLQDRLVLRGPTRLTPGLHRAQVSLTLMIPHLSAGPDTPVTLPFHEERNLGLDDVRPPSLDAGNGAPRHPERAPLAAPLTISVSAFNWTPEVHRAERTAGAITLDVVADGVASLIEVEAGQLWRSFPVPSESEVDAFGSALHRAGGQVSLVGISLDEFIPPARRRSGDELMGFVIPQLRAAGRLGATGVRLPLGQAGPELLTRLQPVLHELDLILVEEAQGRQVPGEESAARAYQDIADLDDPRIRVLVDTSMFMQKLPVTFLSRMRSGGLPAPLLSRLTHEWQHPETHDAVVEALRQRIVPPPLRGLFMNLIVRFGRSQPAEVRDILPLVHGFHLKAWDLEDADGRVSQPVRDLGRLLEEEGWSGTLCSEWGGHEWLDDDPTDFTLAHLALVHAALSACGNQDPRG